MSKNLLRFQVYGFRPSTERWEYFSDYQYADEAEECCNRIVGQVAPKIEYTAAFFSAGSYIRSRVFRRDPEWVAIAVCDNPTHDGEPANHAPFASREAAESWAAEQAERGLGIYRVETR